MSAFTYCLATKVVAIAGFLALVVYGHPWWVLLCFPVVASVDGEIEP